MLQLSFFLNQWVGFVIDVLFDLVDMTAVQLFVIPVCLTIVLWLISNYLQNVHIIENNFTCFLKSD